MSKAYTELYYHLVWATWKRQPFLRKPARQALFRYIAHKCQEYGYPLNAVNGVKDHVHVVVRLDPTVAVSEAVRKLKGSSSRFCNSTLEMETEFQWQEGYGAFTFRKHDLPGIVAYVEGQEERHRSGQLDEFFEAYGEA